MQLRELIPCLHPFTELYIDWHENGKTSYHGDIQSIPKYLFDRIIWNICPWSTSSIIITII